MCHCAELSQRSNLKVRTGQKQNTWLDIYAYVPEIAYSIPLIRDTFKTAIFMTGV